MEYRAVISFQFFIFTHWEIFQNDSFFQKMKMKWSHLWIFDWEPVANALHYSARARTHTQTNAYKLRSILIKLNMVRYGIAVHFSSTKQKTTNCCVLMQNQHQIGFLAQHLRNHQRWSSDPPGLLRVPFLFLFLFYCRLKLFLTMTDIDWEIFTITTTTKQ